MVNVSTLNAMKRECVHCKSGLSSLLSIYNNINATLDKAVDQTINRSIAWPTLISWKDINSLDLHFNIVIATWTLLTLITRTQRGWLLQKKFCKIVGNYVKSHFVKIALDFYLYDLLKFHLFFIRTWYLISLTLRTKREINFYQYRFFFSIFLISFF